MTLRDRLMGDFLRGMYAGRIVRIYERKLGVVNRSDGYGTTYRLILPHKWGDDAYQVNDRLVILETATKDLVILHPETFKEVGGMLEGILKANKDARIVLGPKEREAMLWKIYRKYKGPWKVAERFKGREKKRKSLGGKTNLIGW